MEDLHDIRQRPGRPAEPDPEIPRDLADSALAAVGDNGMAAAISGVIALTDDIRHGRVAIDPETGGRLVAALREQCDDAAGGLERAQALVGAIPLGDNGVALAMSAKFHRRADSDQTSLLVVLRRYVEVLADATEAVTGAMANYQDTDHERAGRMRTVDA
ncbi:hypothetical protein CLV68_6017 [Actinokineospora cianjurensis]|uniref:Excreted virulence factor EspC (Type VII ESX diderm) n=1 Tax=Actinokineospora cianjurensis TaxID=585224 RepID=A0A421AW86_9PSEU|nr:hypothetical protein CLV68_6017 [Actinokineospora cianjurensis]